MSGIDSFKSDTKSDEQKAEVISDAQARNEEEEEDDNEYDPGVFTQENPVAPQVTKRKSGVKGGSGRKGTKVGSGKKRKLEITGNKACLSIFK